jgi:hypothetical protein
MKNTTRNTTDLGNFAGIHPLLNFPAAVLSIVIILHPPISICGISKARTLAKNIPIARPNCVCGLVKNIK